MAVVVVRKPVFAPWRKDALRAATMGVWAAALALLAPASAHPLGWGSAAALSALAAAYFLRRFFARRQGKAIERAALRHLRHALKDCDVELQTNVLTQQGDIDALVRDRRKSITWVIEIKSHRDVRIDGARLRNTRGQQRDFSAAVQQCRAHARRPGDRPVLWFPAAYVCTSGWIGPVQVVTGNAHYLRDACEIGR